MKWLGAQSFFEVFSKLIVSNVCDKVNGPFTIEILFAPRCSSEDELPHDLHIIEVIGPLQQLMERSVVILVDRIDVHTEAKKPKNSEFRAFDTGVVERGIHSNICVMGIKFASRFEVGQNVAIIIISSLV